MKLHDWRTRPKRKRSDTLASHYNNPNRGDRQMPKAITNPRSDGSVLTRWCPTTGGILHNGTCRAALLLGVSWWHDDRLPATVQQCWLVFIRHIRDRNPQLPCWDWRLQDLSPFWGFEACELSSWCNPYRGAYLLSGGTLFAQWLRHLFGSLLMGKCCVHHGTDQQQDFIPYG